MLGNRSNRRGLALVVVGSMGALLGLASCGATSNEVETPVGYSVATYQDTPVNGLGDLLVFEGTLAVSDGCLVVETTNDIVLVIFKAGTFQHTSEGNIRLYNAEYRMGDQVTLYGVFSPVEGVVIPAECAQAQANASREFTVGLMMN